MTVESDVAVLGSRLDAHESKHDEHREEFGKLWMHVETGNRAREATNLQMASIAGEVKALGASVAGLSDFIKGDLRKAMIGGALTVGILAALLALALTVGPAGVSVVVARWLSIQIPAVP